MYVPQSMQGMRVLIFSSWRGPMLDHALAWRRRSIELSCLRLLALTSVTENSLPDMNSESGNIQRKLWLTKICFVAVFMEAPESVEEMSAFCSAAPNTPKMANIIEGGRTPALPPAELERLGFKFSIYSVTLLSAAVGAMQRALADLGAGRPAANVIPFSELCETVGFGAYSAESKRYAFTALPPAPSVLPPLTPVSPKF